MKIKMQECNTSEELAHTRYNIAFFGKGLDERGTAGIEFITKNSDASYFLEYDAPSLTLTFNTEVISIDDLAKFLQKFESCSVILETTTLGFVEVLLLSKYMLHKHTISFLYIEPQKYRQRRHINVLSRRSFELSGEVLGYLAIPGFTRMFDELGNQCVVFSLGYEGERINKALEEYPMIDSKKCQVIFGVPAFNPGWENDSFANNISTLVTRNITGGINYCGANNPYAFYEKLKEIKSSLDDDERMFVVPIGTKPASIGIAIFAVEYGDIGILYDHPKRENGRTGKIAKWHLYDVIKK